MDGIVVKKAEWMGNAGALFVGLDGTTVGPSARLDTGRQCRVGDRSCVWRLYEVVEVDDAAQY